MKIVILSSWFSERMGYIENCLPKALAKLGHEVHVVTSTAQVYYNSPDYDKVYEPFLGKNIQEPGTKNIDGYQLHRISFTDINNRIFLKGLGKKVKEIAPDVVQVFDAFSYTTLQAAYYKVFLGYKLFTANHTVASVFPLFQKGKNTLLHKFLFFVSRTIPGMMVSLVTSRCFPATIDALNIAVKYYGVPQKKVKLASLGVDTDFFSPVISDEKSSMDRDVKRMELGFKPQDIVCIYTGRFTDGKNPLCLAQAIDKLVDKGEPFKGLFMGNGPQLEEITKMKGCVVHEFVPYHQLPIYYVLADIGVWPRQESTSMIDAAACGLPIIISDRVFAKERVEGNGLTYVENDSMDLVNTLLEMKDAAVRKSYGVNGSTKIKTLYSWDKIAKDRIEDYKEFI